MAKSAHILLAALRARLQRESDLLERRELRRRIRYVAADIARQEYLAQARPLLRAMAGAY